MGLNTVYDLAVHANPQHIQQLFSIVVKRTVPELQGTACIELEHTKPDQKQIFVLGNNESTIQNAKLL